MRTAIGLILVLIGMAIALYGIGGAMMQVIGLYQGAIADPLGQPEGAEKAVSVQMMRHVIIGLFGVPPLISGSVLLKIGMYQRMRRRFS